MAGGLAGKSSSDRRQKKHVTIAASVQDRQRKSSKIRHEPKGKDGGTWAHLLVPVFGVAAAASIALYTRYLNDLKRRGIAVQSVENNPYQTSRKLKDLSLAAKNGSLVKSRSAFA